MSLVPRQLLRSGGPRPASVLALGCEILGGADWGRVNKRAAEETVGRAWDAGINVFDTADVYGLGESERRLSALLGSRRHDALIVTKFGVAWRRSKEGRAVTSRDSSPVRVAAALEASLKRLRIDQIPVFLVHWPDPQTPLEETLDALSKCQAEGKVGAIGLSNFAAPDIARARRIAPISWVESKNSLVCQSSAGDVLQVAAADDIDSLAYGCLGHGLLTGKYGPDTTFLQDDRRSRQASFSRRALERFEPLRETLLKLARQYQTTPAALAVGWCLRNLRLTSVVVGARNVAQLDENIASVDLDLPTHVWKELGAAGSSVEDAWRRLGSSV